MYGHGFLLFYHHDHHELMHFIHLFQVGQQQLVLVEGRSKRSKREFVGRNDGNTRVSSWQYTSALIRLYLSPILPVLFLL